jgi:hypothetical protein
MKHTTFENELREIRRRAVRELYEAIKAHNGEIDFTKYDKCPILDEEKVCVIRAFDDLSFIDTEYSYLTTDDLTIEDILYIIGTIPETDEVKDVSGVYPAPVTWVDRDDIENEGFDASDVTQEKLNRIAEIMQEYSCLSTQYDIRTSDLYAACTKVCLNQKED